MNTLSLLPSAPARYYDEDLAVHTIGRRSAYDGSVDAPEPGAPGDKSTWKLRAAVYSIPAVLLVTAIGAFGGVIPTQFSLASSRAKLLLASAPAAEAKSPTLTREEFLSAKSRIWKHYREQVRQCARVEVGRQDACFEQARRDRKATLAEAKSQIVPLPHSPEDRKVALY